MVDGMDTRQIGESRTCISDFIGIFLDQLLFTLRDHGINISNHYEETAPIK